MKRIGFVVCDNGLGHFRRVVQVVEALLRQAPEVQATVVCSSRQRQAFSGWTMMHRLCAQPRVCFRSMDLYPRWHTHQGYYQDEHLLTWHCDLEPLGLDAYDVVVSDNLVEPLRYQPKTILMGSFLWHGVYAAHYGDEPVVQRYHEACLDLLQRYRPPMIVNRYFAMPALRDQVQPVEVGMLPAVAPPAPRHDHQTGGVLFVGGINARVAEALAAWLEARAADRPATLELRVFVDRRLAQHLPARYALPVFDFDRDTFAQVDVVVARPSMGIITDCIATGTPLFFYHEDHVEMAHNAEVLERLGLGRRLHEQHDVLDQVRAFFEAPEGNERYRQAWPHIDLQGLEQTVAYLRRALA